MNQILVTEKIYVTPELRRKKKLYKVEFFLSIFLICLLFSYYIYAEYDKTKTEAVSKQILDGLASSIKKEDDQTMRPSDKLLVVALSSEDSDSVTNEINTKINSDLIYTTDSGKTCYIGSVLKIDKLDLEYSVLSETSEELLKASLNKYWGPEANEIGNYCIVGHNYKNGKLFGNLSKMETGDIAELTNAVTGKTTKYSVYNKYVVNPDDTSCTSQLTNGKKELTLITCTNYGTQRLVIKCREIK